MKTTTKEPLKGVDLQRLVRLGVGKGRTHREQVLALGLKVGDSIRGEKTYSRGWNEVRLTLMWIGEKVVVYRKKWRAHYAADKWMDAGETANFTLDCREWFLEPNRESS